MSPASQGLKRPHEEVFDPTAKRPRWNASKFTKRKFENKLDSQAASRLEPQSDARADAKVDSRSVSNGRHHLAKDESPRVNGTISPAAAAADAAAAAAASKSALTTSPVRQSSPRHRHNGVSTRQSSGNHSPINGISNGLTNGHGNPPHRTNGHARVESSSIPSSSPDSHHGGDDGDPEYLRCVGRRGRPRGVFVFLSHKSVLLRKDLWLPITPVGLSCDIFMWIFHAVVITHRI